MYTYIHKIIRIKITVNSPNIWFLVYMLERTRDKFSDSMHMRALRALRALYVARFNVRRYNVP